jgi:hypothetical protein
MPHPCEVYDDSLRHRIVNSPFGVVKQAKRTSKAHDVLTQRRIHALAYRILSDGTYSLLFTPELSDDQTLYEMRKVDTREPIWLGQDAVRDPALIEELVRFWKAMYQNGFAMLDIELYRQSNGRVVVIDYDSTGFHMTGANECILIPGKTIDPAQFFIHPCFPPDFEERLNMRMPIGKRNNSA